ncbi:Zinc finger, C6HC-type [Cynara cardunculus var. scolymus]|uniref:RBR-type E3 ubiquitin transferase n=1 Tax=Cynara cardunculus var. scolymus TaxID=59895 RepID=A0A103YEN8_CYNCS|nr:Zinc finger, C6HC-type [Cynara cardunculus var. scolymus]
MAGTSSSDPILIEDDDPFHILEYDFYISFLQEHDQIFPISDENFAHQLHLQQALLSSLPSSSSSSSSLPPSSSSPSSSTILCEICMDTKLTSEMFRNTNVCTHSYCFDCIRGHVAAKIKENITQVKCPHLQCKGLIGPEICRSIVPKEVLERWENSLCESMILASEKITYCPFKDCSAMLVDDGAETVTSSVCPNCNRLFCASCNVVWHSGFDCNEFRGLKKGEKDPEDLKLMDLAKRKKWKRCPNCKDLRERKSCSSIKPGSN